MQRRRISLFEYLSVTISETIVYCLKSWISFLTQSAIQFIISFWIFQDFIWLLFGPCYKWSFRSRSISAKLFNIAWKLPSLLFSLSLLSTSHHPVLNLVELTVQQPVWFVLVHEHFSHTFLVFWGRSQRFSWDPQMIQRG